MSASNTIPRGTPAPLVWNSIKFLNPMGPTNRCAWELRWLWLRSQTRNGPIAEAAGRVRRARGMAHWISYIRVSRPRETLRNEARRLLSTNRLIIIWTSWAAPWLSLVSRVRVSIPTSISWARCRMPRWLLMGKGPYHKVCIRSRERCCHWMPTTRPNTILNWR